MIIYFLPKFEHEFVEIICKVTHYDHIAVTRQPTLYYIGMTLSCLEHRIKTLAAEMYLFLLMKLMDLKL